MPFKKGSPKPETSGSKSGQKYAPTLRRELIKAKFYELEDRLYEYAESLQGDELNKFISEYKEFFDPKLSRSVVDTTIKKGKDYSDLSMDQLKASIKAIQEWKK